MRTLRKVLFASTIIIGLCIITVAITVITGISVLTNDSCTLNVSTNTHINDLVIAGKDFASFNKDSYLIFDVPVGKEFKYLEINIADVQNNNALGVQLFYAYEAYDFKEEQSIKKDLKVGRNFIELPVGEYHAICIDIAPSTGDVLTSKSISLSTSLPLRFRHIFALGFFGVLWCIICWVLFFYNLSLIVIRLKVLMKYSYLLFNLVKKDFTTKYRRSILGVLWSVLNPLLMALVISAVFSTIFRVQIENFTVYYLTGILIFNFMTEATSGSLTSILGAAGLIKKVYIPKYIFPLEKCLFALVNTLFALIATVILMPFLGVVLAPTVFLFWVPMIYVLVFSVGFGMLLSAANVFFRDIGHLYSVWITAWMYLTPVLYPAELIPDKVKWFISANPMYYYVRYFRDVMMYNTIPDFKTNVICGAFAIAFLLIGLITFKCTQDRFILYV